MGGDQEMEGTRAEEWVRSYFQRFSLYDEFTQRIRNLVEDLVQSEKILSYAIEGRTKTPGELTRYLSMSPGDAPASLDEIPALATVRILLHFPEDVVRVEQILQKEFLVDLARSTPSSKLEDPDRFGYPAIQYVLSLDSTRSALREWEKYRGLKATVQVRTVIQEAWAVVSPQFAVPMDTASRNRIRRKLSRISALLEEADEGFLEIRGVARTDSIPVAAPVEQPEPVRRERNMTLADLTTFFDEHPETVDLWSRNAVQAGFQVYLSSPEYREESLSYLFDVLRAADISTIDAFTAFIADVGREDKGLRQLQSICKAFEKEVASWKVDAFSALFLLVLNLRWDILQNKDLVALNVKKGSDRIKGQ